MDVRETLGHLSRPFSFAIVSDTHFVTREFNRARSGGRPLNAKDYLENVTYALAPMMDALRVQEPDFIVMTGDIVESQQDDQVRDDLKAGLDFFSTCDIPLLFARGNLDGKPAFEAVIKPHLETTLGWMPETEYYVFDTGGCRFVVLDTTTWQHNDAQHRWLEKLLKERGDGPDRLFLLGHHPIWPVARAFCSPLDFCHDLAHLLAQYPIDAYFCGHSHNQNIVLHRTQGLPVLQCMSAMIGMSDEPPTVLDQVQAQMLPPDQVMAHWPGYLENTAPGWFLVQVDAHQVTTEWHHLNRGAEAVVRWYRPGDICAFWTMDQAPPEHLITTDLARIRRAFLRFCAWHGEPGLKVFLNGDAIGDLPATGGFAPIRFEMPNSVLPGLQIENRLCIQAPEGCRSTLGNLVLEVVLPGGRYVRTVPSGDVFSWADLWQGWDYDKMKVLSPGQSLTTMLCF